jgi:hypothetical protein
LGIFLSIGNYLQQNPRFYVCFLGGAKMRKLIIIILALLGLVACGQPSLSEEQTANLSLPKEDPAVVTTTVPTPEKEPFTASISAPNQLKSNEVFIVEATLKNLSDSDFTILHKPRQTAFQKNLKTCCVDDSIWLLSNTARYM